MTRTNTTLRMRGRVRPEQNRNHTEWRTEVQEHDWNAMPVSGSVHVVHVGYGTIMALFPSR